MGNIIVDTSVWINFLNGKESHHVTYLRSLIIENAPIYLCPTIIQEVLQGIKMDKDYEKVRDSLLAFPIIKWDPIDSALAAAQLYRNLRKKGVTVRKSNDCLIAVYAQKIKASILHLDRDFTAMAKANMIKEVDLS